MRTYLREHPDDEPAVDLYGGALAKAHVQAENAVRHVLHALSGSSGDYPTLEQVRFGQADPYCVRWERGEEPEPELGDVASPAGAPAVGPGLAEAGRARAAAEH